MTREEAIEELKTRYLTMSQCFDREELHKANKAIDEAIKLLEQENILDKIRAEIEEVELNITYKDNHKVGGTWGLRKALEIIDKYKTESENKE